jgi:hypothetical protein
MFKENTLSWAAAWALDTGMQTFTGRSGTASANDETLPPLPPAPGGKVGSFGGRQRRYQLERLKQLRVYDPITQKFVTFGHERLLHAWLLVRFNPDVSLLEEHPKPLTYLYLGQRVVATPNLRWTSIRTGRTVLFWLRQEWAADDRRRYELFSRTHSADVVLVTWDELESAENLVDNLQLGRQVMAMVQFAGQDIRPLSREIMRHLIQHNGCCSRGELGAELCCESQLDCSQHIDAALFHLHALGRLRLSIAESEFGDETVVCCA